MSDSKSSDGKDAFHLKGASMITICARYNEVLQCNSPLESLTDTVEHLQGLEDAGECFALGIYDPVLKTMHIPENVNKAVQGRDRVLQQKMDEFKDLGLQIDKIEFYDQSE